MVDRCNFSLIANSGEGPWWSWWLSSSLLFLGLVLLDNTWITARDSHFSVAPEIFVWWMLKALRDSHLLIWGQLLSWCTLQCSLGTKYPREIIFKRLGNFKLDIRQTEMGIINFSELSHSFRRMKEQVSDDMMWTGQLKEACFSGAHLRNAGWCPEGAMLDTAYDLMLTPRSVLLFFCGNDLLNIKRNLRTAQNIN